MSALELRPRFLLIEEAAAIARCPVATVRYWMATGRLRKYRPGKRVLIAEADLIALIEGSAS